MNDKVGIIGLGRMGMAISENLLKEGFPVTGFDVLPDKTRALAGKRGSSAHSCREVADGSEVVITSLPSESSLKEVVAGKDGLVKSKKSNLIIIETSTLSLASKQEAKKALEQAGAILLDCPLSGTAAQAAKKDLAVYASGDLKAYQTCTPVFEGFARSHHYIGEFGTGSKMKFVANLLVAIHNVSAAEAIALGKKAGLDPQMIYDVIRDGAGSSRMFEVRGPLMVSKKYDDVTMQVDLFQKDIDIITDFANSLNSPIPLLSAAAKIYAKALEKGHAKKDTASVCDVMEKLTDI